MYLFKFSLQYGGGIRGDDDSLAIYGQINKKKKNWEDLKWRKNQN